MRAFDIMGNKGFLISNYQEDYEEYFKAGEDYIYYTDYEDLGRKAEYFLGHEKEREEIALNGYRKVKEYHTYEKRVETMMEIVF